jgi:hypothetical protein
VWTAEHDDIRGVDPPRRLRADERELIDELLQRPFKGRDEIRAQLEVAVVVAEGKATLEGPSGRRPPRSPRPRSRAGAAAIGIEIGNGRTRR